MSNRNKDRNYPYGGYDPFKTPSAKLFAQSVPADPARPPYQPSAPAFPPMAPYGMGFQQQMPFPGAGPMPMPMPMPFQQPGMFGFPQNQQQSSFQNFQKPQSNWNWGSTLSGANQVMGIMKQLGGLAAFFK
ncbi:hypothetical protein ACFFJY_10375 [Fictibacillus aquaticus]|uniref:Uncharacterized protein n=1 Tax=Fictibacillus aquaticus TaxID=2021314 RepID=A0A235FCA6_9BACL|nr:hypothetical protein [Fictibacillus aquaticus]OYD58664.1 hypothetical protein CGZ90_01820 [Fictibacillus aquaticus]